MKFRRHDSGEESRPVEINLSPLIDCVFLLLIFFVVTTVFVDEAGMDVSKPSALSSRALERTSIQLAIDAEGRIGYAGRIINLNAVRGVVSRQLTEGLRPVILLADQASRTGDLIAVMDECKLAGAETVSVATQTP
jgi:biopolymer transport protein ExbD